MLVIPMAYDDMPHTEETETVLLSGKLDHLPLEDFKDYLRESQLLCVFNRGKMAGFYLELLYDDCIEVHCFIYPSQRRKTSIPLMKWIRQNALSRDLYVTTSVFSCYPYIEKFLKMSGLVETQRQENYGTFNGEPISMIYLSDEGSKDD